MSEHQPAGASQRTDVALQAFLYAHGELSPEETIAFEMRLEQDALAREALVQAVEVSLPLTRPPSRGPNPAYRERVRERLRRRWWDLLVGKRTYRGHPLLWSGLSAAAAVLLTLLICRPYSSGSVQPPAPQAESKVVAKQEIVPPEPIDEPEPEPSTTTGEMAQVWAELHQPDHLLKVHARESRRKGRHGDRRPVWAEERRFPRVMPPCE